MNHSQDERLPDAVRWLRELGVHSVRTGLIWAHSFRPGAEEWFGQMALLDPFDVTLTFCSTRNTAASVPTSLPKDIREHAEFCARMTRRYC